jgi:hypothetical protein
MARLPARVYWFRRLMVLAIVAAMVFAVLRVAGGRDDSTSPVSTESSRGHQPASQVGHRHHRGRQDGHQQQKHEPAPTGDCGPGQIRLTPVVADGIRVGQDVAIQVALRITGTDACSFALTPDNLVVDITTSKGDPVWTTDECGAAITPTSLVLRADKPAIVQVTWDGTRSDAHCSPRTVRSAAGDYEVRTAIIGGEPAAASFTIAEPLPQATPSETPSANPSSAPASGQHAGTSSSPSPGHT